MKIARLNRSTLRKAVLAPLCPPQIPLARPRLEPGPPPWEASDLPLELWCGLSSVLEMVCEETLELLSVVVVLVVVVAAVSELNNT
jgi:hypothetical protein